MTAVKDTSTELSNLESVPNTKDKVFSRKLSLILILMVIVLLLFLAGILIADKAGLLPPVASTPTPTLIIRTLVP